MVQGEGPRIPDADQRVAPRVRCGTPFALIVSAGSLAHRLIPPLDLSSPNRQLESSGSSGPRSSGPGMGRPRGLVCSIPALSARTLRRLSRRPHRDGAPTPSSMTSAKRNPVMQRSLDQCDLTVSSVHGLTRKTRESPWKFFRHFRYVAYCASAPSKAALTSSRSASGLTTSTSAPCRKMSMTSSRGSRYGKRSS